MDPQDSTRFLKALAAMGLMFSDEVSRDRQVLYWHTFRDRCTIDEWEYAASEAMRRETFHKVPLPAVLLDYIREYRAKTQETQARYRSLPPGRNTAEDEDTLRTMREALDKVLPGWNIPDPNEPRLN